MKRRSRLSVAACLLLSAALLLGGCSRRGAHMPRHRKSRHCDCPSFSLLPPPAASGALYAAGPFAAEVPSTAAPFAVPFAAAPRQAGE